MSELALELESADSQRQARYDELLERLQAILQDESDWITAMATVVCELHHSFAYYHWTGFYRVVAPELLKIGPYQGGHGCLVIPFARGVCGAAARTATTQLVDNVHEANDHIACSSTTNSEIVVPVMHPEKGLMAVLDVDSDHFAAFRQVDQEGLEKICRYLGQKRFQF
ncbi:MAG: GAF domain-containing protein [Oligoflexus sp.]